MQKIIETLTELESLKILDYFTLQKESQAQANLHTRDQLIVLLMLDAGLRVGEVVQQTVGDLNIAGSPVNVLRIRKEITKTITGREVPVTIRLHDAIQLMWLNTWQPHKFEPWMFAFATSPNGLPITIRQIQRMIKTVSKLTIGKAIHPHVLRHTFATRLMRSCNIRIVQQLLGHASLQSTQVYTHPNSEDLDKAIATLNA